MDPRRVRGIAAAGLLLLAAVAAAGERAGTVRIVVQSSPLAGFRYYDAGHVWPDMRVGDVLELAREPENTHDPRAVRVSWRGRMLGYVPQRENGALAWALDRGETLRARISRLSAHPNPARRVEFEVYLE
jgi:hypothetical protein